MKVESPGPVAKDPISQAPAPKAASPSWQYRSVLYSCGKTCGWGIFVCLSFLVRKSFWLGFSLVRALIPKKQQLEFKPISTDDLLIVGKFEEHFKSDPFRVIMTIFDLINEDPQMAQKILANYAHHCKDNKRVYSPYGGGIKVQLGKRKEFLLKLNDLVINCILSPLQREIEKKIEEGDLDESQASVISYSKQDWLKREHMFEPEYVQFRHDYKEAQARKEQFNVLWQTVLSQLDFSGNFNDLALNDKSTENNPFREETVTFGGFVERLLLVTDAGESTIRMANLKRKENFNHWAKYSIELCDFILTEKTSHSLPPIRTLAEKLKAILENDKKRAAFHGIISAVVAIFRPNE